MKKLFTIIFLCLFGIAGVSASASQYRINSEAVDQMFAGAESVDFFAPAAMAPLADLAGSSHAFITEDKNPAIAFILAWAVGYLGIHRAYLGTSTSTIVAYILTLGGCGVVALVDWVVLLLALIDDDISKYVDNPKFFMW
jgi:TM2 domain-containing membrane protein YozV